MDKTDSACTGSAENVATEGVAPQGVAVASASKESVDEKKAERLQLIIALLLAVTALLGAYATWMNQLHSSNMSANYAYAGRLSAEATALSATKTTEFSNDLSFWGEISSLESQRLYYAKLGDSVAAEAYQDRMNFLLNSYDATFAAACKRALAAGGVASPFDEFPLESYLVECVETSNKASEVRAEGDWDNLMSDSYGLAQVLYSVVLFLLGIASAWKERKPKCVIIGASVFMLLLSIAYVVFLPLPTDFSFFQYMTNLGR